MRRLFDKIPDKVPAQHVLPVAQALQSLRDHQSVNSITWLGHASFLIHIEGQYLLTDPYLSEYASPIVGLGPRRFVPPGIPIEALPPLDALLISHNHYDHLDKQTLLHLKNKATVPVVLPLRLGDTVKKWGYEQIHELNWYESTKLKEITITLVPAYHFSKRSLFDTNKTLWGGFIIEAPGIKLFFTGDTAYGDIFKRIGEQFGPIDYAMVGIGAYAPEALLCPFHSNPRQAIQIAQDVQAKTVIGMHWGTVILSDEPIFEPPVLFRKAALAAGFPEQNTWIMAIGETRPLATVKRGV